MQEKSKLPVLSLLFLVLLFRSSSSWAQSQQASASSAGCANQRCGELAIRYPFGLTGCPAFSPFFELVCDASSSKLYITLNVTDVLVEVTEINSDSLIVDANKFKATFQSVDCIYGGRSSFILEPYPSPFIISHDNQVGAFGCSLGLLITMNSLPGESAYLAPTPSPTYGTVVGEDGAIPSYPYSSAPFSDLHVDGCECSCLGAELHNPNCGYRTCCTSQLFTQTSAIRVMVLFVEPNTPIGPLDGDCDFNHSYSISFHPNYTDFQNEMYRIKLNWAVPTTETDEKGIMESSDYACSSNAVITIVHDVPGYLCSCPTGWTGDGYSKGSGCRDVSECIVENECVPRSTCHNVEGNYTCSCSHWFYSGDGRISGSGCHLSIPLKHGLISGSVSVSILAMIIGCIYFAFLTKLRTKRQYFVQNGGLQVQVFLKGRMGGEATRLFTAEELQIATNNYAESMKLGAGGSSTVFKGVLNDGKLVAIKRAKRMASKDGDDMELFLNELAILTQINHRHIIRLLGCCLETKVPLLVYEYVSNGNMAENLAAKRGSGFVMGWEQRLKVACQVGEALAYLHAAASPPILHRDVKSANVLLDDNVDAKIADFGLSRLIPEDGKQDATGIQGTVGYLDPEYFFTLQLTDKSDVYSFGVMLAELITGLKAVDSQNRDTRFANLALFFIETFENGSLDDLIDSRVNFTSVDAQAHIYPSIMAVAALSHQCLALEGSVRPSMKQAPHMESFLILRLHRGDHSAIEKNLQVKLSFRST
ncbi:hypothetical protein GOP47_0019882 [Adiantum capillus-veneris]|uniref:Uncharacterized protein n=1 Tax=Adiantum capillus-veneris TaxID=13818 RepID=A0A9D4UCL9_ADICA|nr:hypothetical protein GOP47_0019882 [Adiantum capillus-veneris]